MKFLLLHIIILICLPAALVKLSGDCGGKIETDDVHQIIVHGFFTHKDTSIKKEG